MSTMMAGTQPFEAHAAASRIAPCRCHAQRICRKLIVAKRIDDPIFEGLLVSLFWMMCFCTLTLVQECKEPWCHLMACHETFFVQFKEHNDGCLVFNAETTCFWYIFVHETYCVLNTHDVFTLTISFDKHSILPHNLKKFLVWKNCWKYTCSVKNVEERKTCSGNVSFNFNEWHRIAKLTDMFITWTNTGATLKLATRLDLGFPHTHRKKYLCFNDNVNLLRKKTIAIILFWMGI